MWKRKKKSSIGPLYKMPDCIVQLSGELILHPQVLQKADL